jgi:hypothetical protein
MTAAHASLRGVGRVLSTRFSVGFALLFSVLASIGWCVLDGPSWSWDRAHYHDYAGHAWLAARFGEGLLPGGSQAFLNPLGYVPRALLAEAGWGEFAIAVATAAFQGLASWAVWLIARDRMPGADGHLPAAMMAFLTPLYLSQLGSSYLDVTSGVFVLLAVWACRRGADERRAALAFVALGGAAMGMAVGIKLSNAIPAAIAGILFVGSRHGRSGARAAVGLLVAPLVYGVAAIAGMALTYGAWGGMLYRRFGNPFFPAFDSLFNPQVAVAVAAAPPLDGDAMDSVLDRLAGLTRISGGRFVPQSIDELLSLPWRIADPTLPMNMAYVEWHAPDPRLAVFIVLAACLAVALPFRAARAAATRLSPVTSARMDLRLTCFVFVWLALWVFTSSNGRYGVALLMLASVPIVQGVHRLLAPGRARNALLVVLVVLHAAFAMGMQDRGDQAAGSTWDGAALRVAVPPELREQPTLHVVTSNFSWSYLIPSLHPRSTMLGLNAMCRGDRCHPDLGIERARALLGEWAGRVRVLTAANFVKDGVPGIDDGTRAALNMQLAELDLRIAPGQCDTMNVSPMFGQVWMVESLVTGILRVPSRFGVSCRLEPAPGAAQVARATRDRHQAVFEAIARACPRELGGASGPILWLGETAWSQYYMARDIRVDIRDGQVSAIRILRSKRELGTVGDVLTMWSPKRCTALVWPIDDRAEQRNAAQF